MNNLTAQFLNLTLRSLNNEDGPQLFNLVERNRQRLRNYFPITTETLTSLAACFTFVDERVACAVRKEHFTLVIEDCNKQLQGIFFIKNLDWRVPKAELAYFIDKNSEGKGIMTQALAEVVRYSFDTLGMSKIFIMTSVDNHSSRKIAGKNGFEEEGILRKNFRLPSGDLVDMVYYGRLNNSNSNTTEKAY